MKNMMCNKWIDARCLMVRGFLHDINVEKDGSGRVLMHCDSMSTLTYAKIQSLQQDEAHWGYMQFHQRYDWTKESGPKTHIYKLVYCRCPN